MALSEVKQPSGTARGHWVHRPGYPKEASGEWFVAGQPTVSFGLNGDRPLPLPSAIRQAFFP